MQLIARQEVPSGGVSSITFSSIPADYTDLVLKLSMRTNRGFALDGIDIRLNNTTTNFSWRRLFGDGSATSSVSVSNAEMIVAPAASTTASTFGSAEIYIPNYRSNVAKSISADSVAENNATASGQDIRAILWNNTAAITSIVIASSTGSTLLQYSSASLYGVTAGSDGIVAVS
jgi:hypothetical protein